jgi:hypothetical protein
MNEAKGDCHRNYFQSIDTLALPCYTHATMLGSGPGVKAVGSQEARKLK